MEHPLTECLHKPKYDHTMPKYDCTQYEYRRAHIHRSNHHKRGTKLKTPKHNTLTSHARKKYGGKLQQSVIIIAIYDWRSVNLVHRAVEWILVRANEEPSQVVFSPSVCVNWSSSSSQSVNYYFIIFLHKVSAVCGWFTLSPAALNKHKILNH